MNKVFMWLFGAVSGILATIITIAVCMVENPDSWVKMAMRYTKNTKE